MSLLEAAAAKAYSVASTFTGIGRERVNATAPKRIIIMAIACFAMTTASVPGWSVNASDDYVLFVSVDDTKVCFLSGNFSVAVTRDWPRVIFWHDGDPFSPHFEVSCPRMYAHNDSDGDGVYDPQEAFLTMFLDSNHVEWNMTPVDQGYTSELGRYATFGMSTEMNAYVVGDNETLKWPRWASLSFWFSISERLVELSNPKGVYIIGGSTQLRMNYTLTVNYCIDMDALVLEQFLQGGASTNMFHLTEYVNGETSITEVDGTVDERESGDDFAHEFAAAPAPVQEILFAKEDGVVQAFYRWGSELVADPEGNASSIDIDSTYYTVGNGMMLHSRIAIGNCTDRMDLEASVGLFESGFVGSVTDWIREYSTPVILIVSVALAATILPFLWLRKRKRLRGGDGIAPEEKPP